MGPPTSAIVVNEPDSPRVLAFVLAQLAAPTPAGGLNIIEINNSIATWEFPNTFPPVTAVAILVGGRPGTVYTTKLQIVRGIEVLGEMHSGDAPFTTEIKRVNVVQPLGGISDGGKIVEGHGTYIVRLLINGRPVADTELEIRQVPRPRGIGGPPQQS